jgi:hypothetical protein
MEIHWPLAHLISKVNGDSLAHSKSDNQYNDKPEFINFTGSNTNNNVHPWY